MTKLQFKSVASSLKDFEQAGFIDRFQVNGDRVLIMGSTVSYRPEELEILEVSRSEGASDPSEMSVVYAIEARDGRRGTIIDAYGAYGDAEIGQLVSKVKVRS